VDVDVDVDGARRYKKMGDLPCLLGLLSVTIYGNSMT
jgi:hypothetical protein